MKKIIVFAFCISLFSITIGFAAEPLTLEDFQLQRNNLVRLSQDNAGQIKAYSAIIDIATKAKFQAEDLQVKIKAEFDKIELTIKKLLAVPVAPEAPPVE